MSEQIKRYWQDFWKGKEATNELIAEQFGWENTPMADELAALIASGTKTATCSGLMFYGEGESLPAVGHHSMVLDSKGVPVGIIKNISVDLLPLNEVTEDFAWAEGEGDLSYEYWWDCHVEFFSKECAELGMTFTEDMIVVCERFELVDKFKPEIILEPFREEDLPLFERWLNQDFIYRWFCPEGEEEKQSWLDEARSRKSHYHRFIVKAGPQKIGFCLGIDLSGEPGYVADYYPDLAGKLNPGQAMEIGYCIGEPEFLKRGLGKTIIKKLEEKMISLGAQLLLADSSEENFPSVKVLLANDFISVKENDYRKEVGSNVPGSLSK